MRSLPDALLEQIAKVASEKDEPLTKAQVAAVLAAREAIIDGDPVGTIRQGLEGEIAVRVNDQGVHIWRVTCPDGTIYNNLEPTMNGDWKVIKQGEKNDDT
jgi:hypothetical protein